MAYKNTLKSLINKEKTLTKKKEYGNLSIEKTNKKRKVFRKGKQRKLRKIC